MRWGPRATSVEISEEERAREVLRHNQGVRWIVERRRERRCEPTREGVRRVSESEISRRAEMKLGDVHIPGIEGRETRVWGTAARVRVDEGRLETGARGWFVL